MKILYAIVFLLLAAGSLTLSVLHFLQKGPLPADRESSRTLHLHSAVTFLLLGLAFLFLAADSAFHRSWLHVGFWIFGGLTILWSTLSSIRSGRR